MDCDENKIIAPSLEAVLSHKQLESASTSRTTLTNSTTVTAPKNAAVVTTNVANNSDITLQEKPGDNKPIHQNVFPDAFSSADDLERQDEQIQPKAGWYSFVRYTALNTYRRLFSIVFFGNIVAFIVILVRQRRLLDLVNAAAVNLLICGLARQPLVVNAMFVTACKIPRTAPLRLRMLAAKIFHFGGVHSGCGVASAVWYVAFVALLTYQYAHRILSTSAANTAVLVLAYLILILFWSMIIAAYPTIRSRYHDWFEAIHRFSGWTIILLFWALILTFASSQPPSMGRFLVRQPSFWIIIILTAAVVQPWAMVRKVKVTPEVLSTHATRLHFDFTTTKFGQGISISKHPFRDWHSFASFPDKFDTPGTKFSLVVSKAGDFTGDLINNPPSHIYKRSVPAYGFGYVMRLVPRMILVTTGSGIGPCLSFLGDDNRPKMRVLWQTRTPEKTYGQRIIKLVHEMDPDPVILDTSKGGRIDMLPFVIKLYKEFKAEAVCVISNPVMTKKLVYGLERRGIIAMGPIFDS